MAPCIFVSARPSEGLLLFRLQASLITSSTVRLGPLACDSKGTLYWLEGRHESNQLHFCSPHRHAPGGGRNGVVCGALASCHSLIAIALAHFALNPPYDLALPFSARPFSARPVSARHVPALGFCTPSVGSCGCRRASAVDVACRTSSLVAHVVADGRQLRMSVNEPFSD